MEIPEFELYLMQLNTYLRTEETVKAEVCEELRQALYARYNDCLIKGLNSEQGIAETLSCFEQPKILAAQFNRVHCGVPILSTIETVLFRTPAVAMVLVLMLFTLLV